MNAGQHLGYMYIARRPCGCLSAMAWDEAGREKSTADSVARWIRRGDTVERLQRLAGEPMPDVLCAEHRQATPAV